MLNSQFNRFLPDKLISQLSSWSDSFVWWTRQPYFYIKDSEGVIKYSCIGSGNGLATRRKNIIWTNGVKFID